MPVRQWFNPDPTSAAVRGGNAAGRTIIELLEHWDAIEADFHRFYGVDLEDGILTRRRWRWFMARLVGLLGEQSRLAAALGLTTPMPPLSSLV